MALDDFPIINFRIDGGSEVEIQVTQNPICDIYIVEGPAGSGKTTFIQKLCSKQEGYVTPKEELEAFPKGNKRDFGVGSGLMAMMRDAAKISSVFPILYQHVDQPPKIVIDRWLLSGYVYDTLRTWSPVTELTEGHFLKSDLMNRLTQGLATFNSLAREYRSRIGFTRSIVPQFHFHFIVMNLNLETLLLRRGLAERQFPFAAEKELTGYNQAVKYLSGNLASVLYSLPETYQWGMGIRVLSVKEPQQ